MKIKLILIMLIISSSLFSQLDITKRNVTVTEFLKTYENGGVYFIGKDTLKGIRCIDINCDSAYIYLNSDSLKIGGIQSSSGGGTGTYSDINDSLKFEIVRTFNDTIKFDYKDNYYNSYIVNSNTVIVPDLTNAKTSSTASFNFIGNGSNTLTFPASWRRLGMAFNNSSNLANYGIAYKHGSRITYNIYDTLTVDLSLPYLLSAYQDDSSLVTLIMSESINTDSVAVMQTSAISLNGASPSSFVGVADTIKITLSTNAVATSVSYTQQYPGAIQDVAGNLAASWADSSITNMIPITGDSPFTINLTNTIVKTGDNYSVPVGGGSWVSYCLFNEFLSSGNDGYAIFSIPSSPNTSFVLGFDAANTNKDYNGYDYGVYVNVTNGAIYRLINGSITSLSTNAAIGSKIKLSRVGGNLLIEYAADGTNFSTLYNFGSHTGTYYVNLNINANGGVVYNLQNSGM